MRDMDVKLKKMFYSQKISDLYKTCKEEAYKVLIVVYNIGSKGKVIPGPRKRR